MFAMSGVDDAGLMTSAPFRDLDPFIQEFATTTCFKRAEATLEEIARAIGNARFPDPVERCVPQLKAVIALRRATTKGEPFGLDAKAVKWAALGSNHDPHEWRGLVEDQKRRLENAAPNKILTTPFSWADPATLPRRSWLYGRHLIRGEVSATLAPGGVGKTSLAIVEALAMVTGFPLLGQEPADELRVLLWNGEEPADEMRRRVSAAMKHFGILPDMVGDRLFISTGYDMPLVLAEEGRDGTQVNLPLIHELTGELRRQRIDAMLVDPFISTHNVSENNNNAIQAAATAWKEVAVGANVAIGLQHHTRKLGGKEATTEDSRGADALISKVRDGRVLNVMSEADAARLGVLGRDRFGYFSTGPGGKSNMSARTGEKAWFRLVSVDLGNGPAGGSGDAVAVVEQWRPPHVGDDIEPERLVKLGAVMGERAWRAANNVTDSPDWIGAAVADAFDLGRAEGWKIKAKALIGELERRAVIAAGTVTDANRKRRPIFSFVGGSPVVAETLLD